MMRLLQKILFTFAMAVGLSVAVFAQKDDDKKPKTPPKSAPPVINPAPKPTPSKPKKSDSAVVIWKEQTDFAA